MTTYLSRITGNLKSGFKTGLQKYTHMETLVLTKPGRFDIRGVASRDGKVSTLRDFIKRRKPGEFNKLKISTH